MSGLTLVDVVVTIAVGGAFLGALSSRRGVLAGLASAVGTAAACWLVAAAVLAWAPPGAQAAVANSLFASLVHPPVAAAEQAAVLWTEFWHWLVRLPWPLSSGR